MRCLVCCISFTLCNIAFAQDPTVPSVQILERLGREQPRPVLASTSTLVPERLTPPILKLKAVVMTDNDHGTALIEVDGRRVRVRLSRPTTEKLTAAESSAPAGLDGIVIQGSTYRVQSFSASSILLTNNSQTLLVQ